MILDKAAAIEHMMRSRWRVTAVAATRGPGQHDVIFDEPHESPEEAFSAALATLRAVHPEAAVNELAYRIEPVHRRE